MIKKIAVSILVLSMALSGLVAQTASPRAAALVAKTYANDPYKLQEYKLKNGLTVFMSIYRDSPRFYSMVATKAGSKNDPHDATGLAHYLEHMLFKGTDKLGTKDFSKEEPLLISISDMYEVYRKTTDEEKRKLLG